MHCFKLKIISCLLCICVVFCTLINVILASSLPTFAIVDETNEVENKKYITSESSIQTVTTPSFSFNSKAQILMEQTTGEILYANNENEHLSPASVTKVMTLLLIMEAIDSGKLSLDDTVTCSKNASSMGGSQIWFKEGETLTIDEALKCICVVSANDVSVAMAELIGGSHENFVTMMNDKAKSLGMNNTHFMNAHGIDEDNHYTSAKDIAIMSRELVMKHPDILKYTTIWMDSIRGGTFELSNTNKLLKSYSGITGLKTGSTSVAGFNLSATATRDNMSLIAVVLTAPTSAIRNEEITQLLNYGFSNFNVKTFATKNSLIQNISINKNISGDVKVVFEQTVAKLLEKGTDLQVSQELVLNTNLSAPIKANDIVGEVIFKDKEGNVISKSNAIVLEDVPRSNFMEYLRYTFNTYLMATFNS